LSTKRKTFRHRLLYYHLTFYGSLSWINQPISSRREPDKFQILAQFFEDYQNSALNHYCPTKSPSDPIGYSRFLLTSLTIIRVMHQKLCQDKRFERLQFHSIDITNIIDLFKFLVLPNREDMIRARDLYDYFNKFTNQLNPDLLTNIEEENSFGVYFANHSTKMKNYLNKLQAQVEQDKETKIQEVRKAKDKYHRLMNSIIDCPCTCYGEKQCRIEQQANNIEVNISECPIPSRQESALAVIFELRMPIEIRSYRDIIWQFINRTQTQTEDRFYE